MKTVSIEPDWRNLLAWMDNALKTNSVIPAKRAAFQKSRDEVAAYVKHLDAIGA